jgi:hypothetical protein
MKSAKSARPVANQHSAIRSESAEATLVGSLAALNSR